MLRSSQSRQTDGSDLATGDRQENAPADRSVLESGCAGERAGESGGGRNTARWSAFSTTIEHRTRRTRPGTGTAQSSLRAVCGRLQYLRPQPTSGTAGDDELTRFLTRRLKLKVNEAKSAVARPVERKFLGFSFSNNKEPKRRIAPKVLLRCKQKIRELTRRTRGISLEQMLKELTAYLRGWKNYFGFCQTPSILRNLDYWIRRRLRSMIWKQWKHGTVRFKELRRRDVSVGLAAKTAGSAHGPWRLAHSPALAVALPNAYFASLGLPSLFDGPA